MAFVDKSGDSMSGNLTMDTGVATEYSAQTGDSSITRNIIMQNLDDYSRSWITWLHSDGRNHVSAGYHYINFSDSAIHNRYEIKTSVSPTNPNPSLMQTRFAIGTDEDLAEVIFNYIGKMTLYQSNGLTPSVTLDTSNGEIKSYLDTSNYLSVKKKSTAGSQIQAIDQTGSSTLDLDSIPSDGTSSAIVRFFRNTNTSGTGTAMSVYKGDGTSTVQHFFGAKSNAYVNATAGNFGIGNSLPSYKLDVNGDINTSGVYRTAGTAGVSGVVSLAKLTTGGANGSLTINNGIVTNIINPT